MWELTAESDWANKEVQFAEAVHISFGGVISISDVSEVPNSAVNTVVNFFYLKKIHLFFRDKIKNEMNSLFDS